MAQDSQNSVSELGRRNRNFSGVSVAPWHWGSGDRKVPQKFSLRFSAQRPITDKCRKRPGSPAGTGMGEWKDCQPVAQVADLSNNGNIRHPFDTGPRKRVIGLDAVMGTD